MMRYEMKYVSRMYCLLKPPPQKRTPETVKNTGYKIDLDFDVIYTKHMLIIYLKIIYLFFFLQNIISVHDPLETKQCRRFGFENMDDV